MIRLDKLVGARLLSACAGTGAPYLAAEGDVSQPILTEEQIEPQPSPGGAGAVARSSWALFRIRFMRDRAAVAGAVILIGVVLGLSAGFVGGFYDTAVSRLVDIVLSMPLLLFAIGLSTVCSISPNGCLHGLLQPGLSLVIGIIALFTWPNIARIVRGQVLSLREREFIEAARSLG